MIKFSDDDKKIVELIVNKYKESRALCSDYKGLVEIGYDFTKLVTWGFEHVDFRACDNGMKIVFIDKRNTNETTFEEQKQLSNEYSPKYIRVLQRIHTSVS